MTIRQRLQSLRFFSAESVSLEPRGRTLAFHIVAAQVVGTGVLSLLGLLISSQIAFAILLGGMICSLANLWLAVAVFRPVLGASPGRILTSFYVGEIGKILIAAALFLVVFKKFPLFKQPLYAVILLAVFGLMQSMMWIYPLLLQKCLTRNDKN